MRSEPTNYTKYGLNKFNMVVMKTLFLKKTACSQNVRVVL